MPTTAPSDEEGQEAAEQARASRRAGGGGSGGGGGAIVGLMRFARGARRQTRLRRSVIGIFGGSGRIASFAARTSRLPFWSRAERSAGRRLP